jgi:hypothetical protein
MTRCSSSKTSLPATARSMAARTRACSSEGRLRAIQSRIGRSLLATRLRPSSGCISDQSALILYTTSELAFTSARKRASLARSASAVRRMSEMSMPVDWASTTPPAASKVSARFVQSVQRVPSAVSKRFSMRTSGLAGVSVASRARMPACSSSGMKCQKLRDRMAAADEPTDRA